MRKELTNDKSSQLKNLFNLFTDNATSNNFSPSPQNLNKIQIKNYSRPIQKSLQNYSPQQKSVVGKIQDVLKSKYQIQSSEKEDYSQQHSNIKLNSSIDNKDVKQYISMESVHIRHDSSLDLANNKLNSHKINDHLIFQNRHRFQLVKNNMIKQETIKNKNRADQIKKYAFFDQTMYNYKNEIQENFTDQHIYIDNKIDKDSDDNYFQKYIDSKNNIDSDEYQTKNQIKTQQKKDNIIYRYGRIKLASKNKNYTNFSLDNKSNHQISKDFQNPLQTLQSQILDMKSINFSNDRDRYSLYKIKKEGDKSNQTFFPSINVNDISIDNRKSQQDDDQKILKSSEKIAQPILVKSLDKLSWELTPYNRLSQEGKNLGINQYPLNKQQQNQKNYLNKKLFPSMKDRSYDFYNIKEDESWKNDANQTNNSEFYNFILDKN